ncbi:MAG: carbon-nitrogen hydrolase family protein [Bradyrhizobium sp.]|nr:carbon-nitrogen hydrolase family protein [Bradyrhizobium sp.]
MIHTLEKIKVAAAHVAPVYLDTERTVDKACSLIAEAARSGAQLIAFPETFIPAFPIWTAIAAPILTHDLFKALAASAIAVDGPEMLRIRQAARLNQVVVSIGFNEGTMASVGCIWNSNALIGADGALLNYHRKLVPTYYEKLVWSNGDGAGLRVVNTAIGRIGMLICGENTNPLARYTLMAQGEQVHISSYPPVWPTRPSDQSGGYDLERAIMIRAGAHSFEAKVFNVVVSACVDKLMLNRLEGVLGPAVLGQIEDTPRGVSVIVGPSGLPLSEVIFGEERILYCDIDLSQCVELKQFHDVVGYYNRFDIFRLEVDRSNRRPINFMASSCSNAADDTRLTAAVRAGEEAGHEDRLFLLDA